MPRLRLVLLGSGSLKADIEHFVREKGLADEVFLPSAISAAKCQSICVLSTFTRLRIQ